MRVSKLTPDVLKVTFQIGTYLDSSSNDFFKQRWVVPIETYGGVLPLVRCLPEQVLIDVTPDEYQ